MTSNMERRRYRRIRPQLKAEEEVMIESETQCVCARIVNLSRTGALLTLANSNDHFPDAGTFNLFFDNGGHSLHLKATALRTDGKQLAFEFFDLSPEARRAIQTKLIRMAMISARIRTIDGNEVPRESVVR